MFCKIYHHFQMQSAVWLWKVTSATTIAYHQRTIITFLDPSLMLQFNQGPHNHNIRKELQYSISRWTLAPSLLLSENEGHYHPPLKVPTSLQHHLGVAHIRYFLKTKFIVLRYVNSSVSCV